MNWTPKQYAYVGLSANQSAGVSANDPVRFNTMIRGNIEFNSATYRATLKANKTYRLSAGCLCIYSANTGYADYNFYDVTNSLELGKRGESLTATYASHQEGQTNSVAVVTPSTDIVVEVRLMAVNSLTSISALYSFWEIQELDTFAPSRAKWQYEYVSPELDLTVTSALTGWTVSYAKGVFKKTNNGIWRLEFNIYGTCGSDTRTQADIVVGGIVWITGIQISGSYGTSTAPCNAQTIANQTLRCGHASATTTIYQFSGNVRLTAKPTTYAIPSDV